MKKSKRLQTQIGKWLSFYTLLLFVCLPIFEVVSDWNDFTQTDFIEVQENLETEIEDISENKELSEKEYKILQTLSSYNEKNAKAGIYISTPLFSNFSSEVHVPPPEC